MSSSVEDVFSYTKNRAISSSSSSELSELEIELERVKVSSSDIFESDESVTFYKTVNVKHSSVKTNESDLFQCETNTLSSTSINRGISDIRCHNSSNFVTSSNEKLPDIHELSDEHVKLCVTFYKTVSVKHSSVGTNESDLFQCETNKLSSISIYRGISDIRCHNSSNSVTNSNEKLSDILELCDEHDIPSQKRKQDEIWSWVTLGHPMELRVRKDTIEQFLDEMLRFTRKVVENDNFCSLGRLEYKTFSRMYDILEHYRRKRNGEKP